MPDRTLQVKGETSRRFPMRRNFLALSVFLGATANRCYVEVNAKTIHLSVGWWFDQVIPRSDVVWIGTVKGPMGSAAGGRRISFFAMPPGNVTEIRLVAPKRMRFGPLFAGVQRIAMVLEDPAAFYLAATGKEGGHG